LAVVIRSEKKRRKNETETALRSKSIKKKRRNLPKGKKGEEVEPDFLLRSSAPGTEINSFLSVIPRGEKKKEDSRRPYQGKKKRKEKRSLSPSNGETNGLFKTGNRKS